MQLFSHCVNLAVAIVKNYEFQFPADQVYMKNRVLTACKRAFQFLIGLVLPVAGSLRSNERERQPKQPEHDP